MGIQHIVVSGECLSGIAARYGLASWRSIYDAPENAEFREQRPNPNVIQPGDRLVIPERVEGRHSASDKKEHGYRRKRETSRLRVVLKLHGEAVANARYELRFRDRKIAGKTGGDGRIDVEVPVDLEKATLVVDGFELTLEVGAINPVETAARGDLSGAQARLRNLGYGPGPVDGLMGPRTRAALLAFQKDNQLRESGATDAPTCDELRKSHGC